MWRPTDDPQLIGSMLAQQPSPTVVIVGLKASSNAESAGLLRRAEIAPKRAPHGLTVGFVAPRVIDR